MPKLARIRPKEPHIEPLQRIGVAVLKYATPVPWVKRSRSFLRETGIIMDLLKLKMIQKDVH